MLRKLFVVVAQLVFVLGSPGPALLFAQDPVTAKAPALPKYTPPKINETLSAEDALIETEIEKQLDTYNESLDAIYQLLTHENPAVREEAINRLNYKREELELQVAPIADRLSDPNLDVARNAGYLLQNLGPKAAAALPALMWAIEQEDRRFDVAFEAIGALGPAAAPAVPRLMIFASKKADTAPEIDRDKVSGAIAALGEIGPAAAAAKTILKAHLSEWSHAQEAGIALGQIGAEDLLLAELDEAEDAPVGIVVGLSHLAKPSAKVLPAMEKYIADNSNDEYDRGTAYLAIGRLRPTTPEILKLLGRGTKDSKEHPRQMAVRAIGEIDPAMPEAIPYLLAALGDENESVRDTAASSLGSLKVAPEVRLDALLKAGSEGNYSIRTNVNYALSNSDKEFWPLIWTRAQDASPAAPLRAYTILGLTRYYSDNKEQIEPFLTKLLADKKQPELVRIAAACVVFYERKEDAEIVSLLKRGLVQEESEAVLEAVLSQINSEELPDTVPLIVELLQRKSKAKARTNEIYSTLESMGPLAVAAVPELLVQLKGPDTDSARYQIPSTLGAIGPAAKEALPALMDAYFIKTDYGSRNTSALYAIGKIAGPIEEDQPEVLNFLMGILNEKPEDFSNDITAAAQALGMFGPRAAKAVPKLIPHLKFESAYDRDDIIVALGNIGPASSPAVNALLMFAKDASKENQDDAIVALGQIGANEDEVILVLSPFLADPELNDEALNAIKAYGPKAKLAVPALVEQLKFGDSYEKSPILETLAGIGPGAIEAFDPLLELMKKSDDNDSSLREDAKKTLEAIAPDDPRLVEATKANVRTVDEMREYLEENPQEAGPLLLELLKSQKAEERVNAIQGLMESYPKGTKTALEAALDDPDPKVQQAAAAALVPFGSPTKRQLDLLMSAFMAAKEDEEIDWKIRGALQNSLRKLGPSLLAAMADTDLSLVKRRQALELLMSGVYLLRPLQKELTALLENPDPSTQQAAAVLLIYMENKDAGLLKFLDRALEGEKESAILSRMMIFQTYVRLASEADGVQPLSPKVVAAILHEIITGDTNNSYSLPHLLQAATLTEEQVAGLVKLLDDKDRANIAYSTLSYAKSAAPEKLVAAMLERMSKVDEDQQFQVVQVLVRNKESSLSPLIALATDSKQPLATRKQVLQSLAQMEKFSVKEGKPLAGLLKDETPAVRQWTAIALAKIATKPDPLLPHLTAALGDTDYSVRSQAYFALSAMGAKAAPAVPELIKLLASEDGEIRSQAVETVRSIGPGAEAAVPALLVALTKAEEEYSRDSIARALRRIGKPAEAQLLAALEQAKGEERIALLQMFVRCRIPAAVPQLKQSLTSENVAEQRAAARALAHYPEADEACVAILMELAKDKDTEQARRGLQALGKIGERANSALPVLQASLYRPQLVYETFTALRNLKSAAEPAVPALIELTENPNHASDAVRVLGEIGSPAAVESLLALLDNDEQAWVAAAALAKIKPSRVNQSLPKLYAKLKDPDRRVAAIGAIGSFGQAAKAAIPTLLKGMKASDNELRSSCISALASVGEGSPEVAEALLPLVDDPDSAIQRVAIDSIGQIGASPKRCVPVLLKKLTAENPDIRYMAIRALGGFKADAASAVPLLLKEPFQDEKTRWYVVNALGEIGPAAAAGVPQLVELLKNGEPNSRYAIVEALGKIGPAASAALPAFEPFTKDEPSNLKTSVLRSYWQIDPVQAQKLGLQQPRENEEYEGEYDDDY